MRKLSLLLGTVLLCIQLLAQTRNVTGRVTDEKGNPISNASVLAKGTKAGTSTKADGSFSIQVPANAKSLVISAVDMASQE